VILIIFICVLDGVKSNVELAARAAEDDRLGLKVFVEA
jgi:hypothetical protein